MKNYLIIGATGDIGFDLIKKLIKKKNVNLVCTGRNFTRLKLFIKKNKIKNKIQLIKLDLLKQNNYKFSDSFDYIVNCSGMIENNLIKYFDKKKFSKTLLVNLINPVIFLSNLYKNNLINKKASIVFLTSINGLYTYRNGSMGYGVSKASIESVVKFMGKEMSVDKIRVNAIASGMVSTKILKKIDFISDDQIDEDKKRYILNKKYAFPGEITNIILFLLSNKSSFITGQTLIADGGYLLS
jgi:3-oxoacyl-[acyl-carrier protein] reductase